MIDGPKPPSDEELDKMLDAMDVNVEGELQDPKEALEPPPPEIAGRLDLLTSVRDTIDKKGEAARLVGFVFVGISEDGVTPVLYSITQMNAVTARLLIAELHLLLARITHNLNSAEDYQPSQNTTGSETDDND
jgi:hypothetical protein